MGRAQGTEAAPGAVPSGGETPMGSAQGTAGETVAGGAAARAHHGTAHRAAARSAATPDTVRRCRPGSG